MKSKFTANSFTQHNLAASSFKSLTSSTSLNGVSSIEGGITGIRSPIFLSTKSSRESFSYRHVIQPLAI